MQLHCLPPTLLQPVCSPLGCEDEQSWSLQQEHFSLLAQRHLQPGSELAQMLLGSNPILRSIPVYVTFMPQRKASKLEFGTLRQTENIPFHHGHVSTSVIYLYTIYFCWIWPALSARVLDRAAVKINWNFNFCCLPQASMPIIGSYWTHWNPKCYRKTIYDFLTLLHPVTPPTLLVTALKKFQKNCFRC